jgi:hypothetical protein
MTGANSTTRLRPDKPSFARVLCLCWPNGKVLSRIDRELGVSQGRRGEREAKYVINIIVAQLLQSNK